MSGAYAALLSDLDKTETAGMFDAQGRWLGPVAEPRAATYEAVGTEREYGEQREGARYRVEVSPGSVRITRRDHVKWDRRQERARHARRTAERLRLVREAAEPCHEGCFRPSCVGCRRYDKADTAAKITAWSAKSRNAMRLRLAALDYAPLFVNFFGTDTTPAMVTLTYPGDWLAVAPDHATVRGHVRELEKRWNRAWADHGHPFVGIWKREFQRRGAPHYHFLLSIPTHVEFRAWLSETWADVVGAEWCGTRCWEDWAGGRDYVSVKPGKACCERGRHVQAGTGVDFHEGARAVDPRRLAFYFAKHGEYAAKEYQNQGPAEWLAKGGVGRFWGVIGLESAARAVEVDPATAQAVARTLRRLERSKRFAMEVRTLRCKCHRTADPATGEMRPNHTKGCFRSNTVVVRRFRGSLGYVIANDGPALAVALARAAALIVTEREWRIYTSSSGRTRDTRSGLGPVGFLP